MTTPDFARAEASWENARLNQHLAGIESSDAENDAWEAYATAEGEDIDDTEARDRWLSDMAQDAMEAAAERQAEMRAEMMWEEW